MPPTTIAIIGAGCAGLGAATAFMDREDLELDVTLIDANAIMGGRARTSTIQGLPVDLGPQFIQDPEINPWEAIMTTMPGYDGLSVGPLFMNSLYRIKTGEAWTTADGNPGINATNDQLAEQHRIASGFANAPVMTGNAPAFFKGQQDLRLSLGSSGYGPISESAEPWQYLVSDQDRQIEVPSAGNIYVSGGLGTLVEGYGQLLIQDNPLKLHFVPNTVVERIDSRDDDVTVHIGGDRSQDYDYCIVTVPCGEIEKIRFEPPLSGERVRADGFIALGSYKKVAFRPTTFPVGDQEQEPAERDSIEENFEYYIYDEDQDGVWQYFRLPTDPTILICVTAGDFARRLDDLHDDAVSPLIIDLLTQAYAGADFTPQNGDIVVTDWTNAPYIHGAYSYTRYDDRLDRDNPIPLEARHKIAEPQGRIHFAGEATWPRAYGTIHGAYYSGDRAAHEILAIIDG